MKSRLATVEDVVYNQYLATCYLSDNYTLTKQEGPLLHKPLFTIQNLQDALPELTYRKINSWDNSDLISYSRDTKDTGWRKFSVIDFLKLSIIQDLRAFGLPVDRVKDIIDNLEDGAVVLENKEKRPETVEFLQLEYSTFACLVGNKIILVVDDRQKVYFLTEKAFADLNFRFKDFSSPLLVLPFFSYVQEISRAMKQDTKIIKETSIAELFDRNLTEQEKKVLDIIKNERYEEITITKSDGNKYKITGKTRRSGVFSDADIIKAIHANKYQVVHVTTLDGHNISIVNDEKMKV
jgi:DNA-binding transcriptional MerR regulator